MKHCTIVGYGPQTGSALAQTFLQEGYTLTLISRTQRIPEPNNSSIRHVCADVSNSTQLINAVPQETDVLLYNAATVQKSSLDISADELNKQFSVGVTGALLTTQQVLPHMLTQKKGSLLFTGGGFAHKPSPTYTGLSIAKAGLRSLVNLLHQEHGNVLNVGLVSVYGKIAPDTPYDPSVIAQAFIKHHKGLAQNWETHIR